MDVNRKRARGDQEIIEISDLPDNLIDNILDRLPLGDAVKTSILSRKLRHHWTRLTNLVFDEKFIANFVRGKGAWVEDSSLCDVIGSVLRLHCGPIHKFVLYVPMYVKGPVIYEQVNKWMDYVSRNGVKDVILTCPTRYRVGPKPLLSNIFRCQELRHLSLRRCKADLPSFFTGFSNLISLHLWSFSADGDGLNVLISTCPLLENLYLKFYEGSLSVSGLRLKTLVVKRCRLDRLILQNVPNLVTASISELAIISLRPHRIETFFDLMPNIESIKLGKEFFNVMALMDQHHIPKTLPTPLRGLKSLTLGSFGAVDRESMLFSFCILRSSPYLQALNVDFSVFSPPHAEDFAATVSFLKEQLSEPFCLKNIITVKMKRLKGTQAEIAFIKFILASCPALEELFLNVDQSLSIASELEIMTDLNEWGLASTKAMIIY